MAWPLVALSVLLSILVFYRGEIKALIRRIVRIDVRGHIIDFSPVYQPEPVPVAEETREEPQDVPDVSPEESQVPAGDYIERYPHASVIQAWRNLELFSFQLLPALGVPYGRTTTLRDLVVRARQLGILGDREVALVAALQ